MKQPDRTFLFALQPAGVGTACVEGFRSYTERLAFEHSFKPRALLEALTTRYPLERKLGVHSLLKNWDVHGLGPVSLQLLNRLEQATGVSLRATTLHRFGHLFPCMHLTRSGDPVHCPECVKAADGLSHGQLLWDVCGVNACPAHGLRLRSSKHCGAPESARLQVTQRPALRSVCSDCGALGFSCITSPPEAATEPELWVAQQVGSLLALSDEEASGLTKESLLQGLQTLVREAFGGVVGAAKRCELSKGSLSAWVRGLGPISLGAVLQLCSFARVDLLKVLRGQVAAGDCSRDVAGAGMLILSRTYQKTTISDDDARAALTAASSHPEPPSLASVAETLGMDIRVVRTRFPEDAKAVADAHARHLAAKRRQSLKEAERAYVAAATELTEQGKKVSRKSVQKVAGLVAFSHNAPRVEILQAVVARFTPATTPPQGAA